MTILPNTPTLHRALPSLNICKVLLPNRTTSGMAYRRCFPSVVRVYAQGEKVAPSKQGRTSRREFFAVVGILATSVFSSDAVLAEKAKGYQAVLDKFDGYSFLYPFGWQEVNVSGQDKTYKDVIEPLESVSVTIVPTSKTDIHELGPPEQVAEALVQKVLSSPSQKTKVLNVKERTAEGKNYYTFEFLAKASNYTRHGLGTVAIGNGKFYTLTTGANERRWGKMENKLRTIADSLTVVDV